MHVTTRLPAFIRISLLFIFILFGLETEVHANVGSPVAGTTPGQFSVNGNGAAEYIIPIEVPPGTNGVAPSLSVKYDSQRKNGLAGVGFSLSGISAITRCPQTIAQDGFQGGVTVSDMDRFCLDGQRLIAVEGKYGGDGTVYHTERESWAKVVSHQDQKICNGVCSFTVTTKTGIRQEFGSTEESRIQRWPQFKDAVIVWGIARTVDRNGNYVDVHYSNDRETSLALVERIDYTGNENSKAEPRRSVRFQYEERPDVVTHYSGAKSERSRRLRTVSTYVDESLVKVYHLKYKQSSFNGRSLLTSLQECDADERCFAPTTFEWASEDSHTPTWNQEFVLPMERGPAAWDGQHALWLKDLRGTGRPDLLYLKDDTKEYYSFFNGSRAPELWFERKYDVPWDGDDSQWIQDVDGDGRVDFLYLAAGTKKYYYARNTGTKPGKEELWFERKYDVPRTEGADFHWIEDLNDDGRMDILYRRKDTGEYWAALQKDDGSFTEQSRWLTRSTDLPWDGKNCQWLLDLNGDNKPDFVYIELPDSKAPRYWAALNNGSRFADLKVWLDRGETGVKDDTIPWKGANANWLKDFTGDGLPDVLYAGAKGGDPSGNYYLAVNTGDGFAQRDQVAFQSVQVGWDGNNSQWIDDLNGDGLLDFLYKKRGEPEYHAIINRGSSFLSQGLWLDREFGVGWDGNNSQWLEDLNNDELPDMIYKREGKPHYYVALNENGRKFGEPRIWLDRQMSVAWDGRPQWLVDYDGDSQLDFLYLPAKDDHFRVALNRNPGDQLQTITDGLGATTSVQYSALTNSDPLRQVFQRSWGAKYPSADVASSLVVVYVHTISDGRPETNDGSHSYRFRHFYSGARIDRDGRGWLGFEKVDLIDESSGVTTRTVHATEFPEVGGVQSVSVAVTKTGELLQEKKYDYYDSVQPYPGVYGLRRKSNTIIQYEDGEEAYSLYKEFEYDDYGNITAVTDKGDASEGDPIIYTCTRYNNDTKEWAIGYPVETKMSASMRTCADFQTWSARDDAYWIRTAYDRHGNLLAESEYLDTKQTWVRSSYSSDVYGNRVTSSDPLGNTAVQLYGEYNTFVETWAAPPAGTTQWGESCAAAGKKCTFSGRRLVKYGHGSQWYYRLASDGIDCSDAVFGGDPAPGVTKACYASESDPVPQVGSRRLTVDIRPLMRHATYEPAFGTKRSETDVNGHVTKYETDGFGRLRDIYGPNPDGNSVLMSHRSYVSAGIGAVFVESSERTTWTGDDTKAWPRERTYIDGLGRTFRTESTGPKSGQDIIHTALFDDAGRTWKQSLAHYTGDQPQYVEHTYDFRNHPIDIIQPNGAKLHRDYDFGSEDGGRADRKVRITMPSPSAAEEGKTTVTRTEYLNSRGQVEKSVAVDGGVTVFEYDLPGRLVRRTDPLGVVTEHSYDSLGRMITSSMPSRGKHSYEYDAAGNLVASTDALKQRIEFTFDGLNRLRSKTVYDAGKEFVDHTKYTYDNTQQKNNLGQISSISTPDITSVFEYDAYGNVTQEKITLGDTTFVLQASYNPDGSIHSSTYPDGSVLRYSYTPEGLPAALELTEAGSKTGQTLVEYDDYTARGQAQKILYGNDMVVDYRYDELGRRETGQAARGGKTIYLRNKYVWNDANKLLAIEDGEAPTHSQRFGYDSAGRLVQASGPYPKTRYEYDANGNLKRKNDRTYTYDGQKKNQLSSISGLSGEVHFDAGGNLRARPAGDGDRWYYDFDGQERLRRVSKGSDLANAKTLDRFTYDDGGRRIKKESSDGITTWYVSPGYEVTELKGGRALHTKYVHGPSGLVASITKNASQVKLVAARKSSPAETPRRPVRGLAFAALMLLAWKQRRRLPNPWSMLRRAFTRHSDSGRRPRRRRTLRGMLRKSTAVLLAAAVFATGMERPLYAGLEPGPNGAGVPVEGISYFHQDHVMGTGLVTDAKGNETSRFVYDPFGKIVEDESSGKDQSRSKFAGKELDHDIDLYYFGARYYDAALGRFISPDPGRQYASPYIYGADDPEAYLDPDGSAAVLAVIALGALIGAMAGGAAVNHDFNPAHWNWKSGQTWAGIVGGGVIGALGVEFGAAVAEAELNLATTLALEGMIGGTENAAYKAMGGGDLKEVGKSFLEGFAMGVVFGGAVRALGAGYRALRRGISRVLNAGLEDAEIAAESGAVCGLSFAKGTEVATEDGPRPIEDIEVGEKVWSYNEASQTRELKSVGRLYTRIAAGVLAITIGTATVEATPEHPFFVAGKGWVEAGELQSGDRILQRDGNSAPVVSVEQRRENRRVFNFTVAGNRNYYAGVRGLLAHNVNCWGKRGNKKFQSFDDFWDNSTDKEFYAEWSKNKKGIMRALRGRGGLHEWGMVSEAPSLKRQRFLIRELRKMQEPTSGVSFIKKSTGAIGRHPSRGVANNAVSSRAHKELARLIRKSGTKRVMMKSLRAFFQGSSNYEYAVNSSIFLPFGP